MSAPKTLSYSASLQSHREEATYTFALLAADPRTEGIAARWRQHLDELGDCEKSQREYWLKERLCQYRCVRLNEQLDALTEEFRLAKAAEMSARYKKRKDAEQKLSSEMALYFGTLKPFALIRMALESQAPLMELWPQKLVAEASPVLRAFAPRFQTLLEESKAALRAREEARDQIATQRVKEIQPLVDRLNQSRRTTYAELIQIGEQHEESKTWPEGFFLRREPPSPVNEEARGKAQAILSVLSARRIAVSEEQQQKIRATLQDQALETMLSKVATAATTEELL